MTPHFSDQTHQAHKFFTMLPQDWQDEIVPFWDAYQDACHLYTIETGATLIGGGIVFTSMPPDLRYYEHEAQKLFDLGFLYFGYLWLHPAYRGQGLGSFWLEAVKKAYPENPLWLAIEDYGLKPFYEKNGFRIYREMILPHGSEWLMVSVELPPVSMSEDRF